MILLSFLIKYNFIITFYTPKDAMTFDSFSIVFFLIGGAVIGGLQLIKHFAGSKNRALSSEKSEEISE